MPQPDFVLLALVVQESKIVTCRSSLRWARRSNLTGAPSTPFVGGLRRRAGGGAHQAVRQPGVLAGGLPHAKPRDAVRRARAGVRCLRRGTPARYLRQHENRRRQSRPGQEACHQRGFEAMTGHYLFEPDSATWPAAGKRESWKKRARSAQQHLAQGGEVALGQHGSVERLAGRRMPQRMERAEPPRMAHAQSGRRAAGRTGSPDAQPQAFDGYVEVPARVSSTALVHLQRNRYSVPSEHAHEVVSCPVPGPPRSRRREHARGHACAQLRAQPDVLRLAPLREPDRAQARGAAQWGAVRDAARVAQEVAKHLAAP